MDQFMREKKITSETTLLCNLITEFVTDKTLQASYVLLNPSHAIVDPTLV